MAEIEREDGSDNSQGFLVAPDLHALGIFQGLIGALRSGNTTDSLGALQTRENITLGISRIINLSSFIECNLIKVTNVFDSKRSSGRVQTGSH